MGRGKTTQPLILLLVLVSIIACERHEPQPVPEPEPLSAVDSASSMMDEEPLDSFLFEVNDSLIRLRADTVPKPGGAVVNIMVTGTDSRLGDNVSHADANHLVRFFTDSGYVEIISIPRDTYADAGFDDTTGFNKLTNVRANKGRTAYLQAVSEITGVQPIHHYVEFGFSQAIGLLELMGYKNNATGTLRVLRARHTYRAGDFQRSYNQGRFIRRVLLTNMRRTDDMVGDLALRAALMLVDTDLTYDRTSELLRKMKSSGFNDDPARIWVRMEPPVVMRVQTLSFSPGEIDSLNARIDQKVSHLGLDSVSVTTDTYEHRLDELLASAQQDSAAHPKRVIRKLKRPFEQRAWLQVTDVDRRRMYRRRLSTLLANAYDKVGWGNSAKSVRDYLKTEEALIGN